MPLRNVATSFTIEQQRLEINNLAGDVNNIATGVTNVGTAATANALAAGATGADLTLSGTLTVNGTQTILNTETLQVEDKEIVIGNVATPTDATAHGGGWKLKGANNKTITYNQTGDKWESNKNFEAPNLAYTSGGQTFSGDITIQTTSTDSADLMIGATGTGEARIYLDASNGDFGGADYAYIKQSDGAGGSGASLRIGNMNDGGIQFLVGEGFGGAGTALTLSNNGDATFVNNINLAEGKKTIFGSNSGNGAYIKHQSGHLEIKNETGNLYWDNIGSVRLRTGASYTTALEIIGQNATFGGTVSDSKGDLRQIPITWHNAATYTLLASDSGKVVSCATNATNITVPASTFVGGDTITIMNHTGNIHTITQGSGVTLYNAADGSTGNRQLATRGLATIFFREHNVAYISGAGLS